MTADMRDIIKLFLGSHRNFLVQSVFTNHRFYISCSFHSSSLYSSTWSCSSQIVLLLLLKSVPADGGPVEDVEDREEDWEENEEGEVSDGVVVLLPLGPRQLPHLHLEEDSRVLHLINY